MQSDHKRLGKLFRGFQELKDKNPVEAKQNFCPFRKNLIDIMNVW